MNNINLMGRLTFKPELKVTPSGVNVCRFQIAVDRKYTPKGEEKKTDFIDCVAWRQTADFLCKYFHKGNKIAVDGSLQTRNYKDKDGNNRKACEVNVENIYFCGGKAPSEEKANGSDNADFEEINVDDDDLPF